MYESYFLFAKVRKYLPREESILLVMQVAIVELETSVCELVNCLVLWCGNKLKNQYNFECGP